MAINEQEFDAALVEFMTTQDEALAAIKAKLDSMGAGSDFADELQMLTDAKTKLSDFVAANVTPAPAPEPGPEPTV